MAWSSNVTFLILELQCCTKYIGTIGSEECDDSSQKREFVFALLFFAVKFSCPTPKCRFACSLHYKATGPRVKNDHHQGSQIRVKF